MKILDWPIEYRPREKLLKQGPEALSDAELLAIFLRTGVKGQSAVALADSLIKQFGGLRAILTANQAQFCQGKGLGEAKYCQLKAITEMAKRNLSEKITLKGVVNDAQQTKEYLRLSLRDRDREVFLVMFLNTTHGVIATEELFQGTIDTASVYPREVMKRSLHHNAAAVIFAHNHPSGASDPSQADIRLTKKLQELLSVVGVRVLDHIVVGDLDVVSLAERGMI